MSCVLKYFDSIVCPLGNIQAVKNIGDYGVFENTYNRFYNYGVIMILYRTNLIRNLYNLFGGYYQKSRG